MDDNLWAHLAKGVEALSPLLLAALSWLSLRIAALISAKVKNERVQGILVRLDDAVFLAVREVEQVFVSMLKTASEDGVLTAEERRQAKDAALQAARSYLGTRGLAELGKVLRVAGGRGRSRHRWPSRSSRLQHASAADPHAWVGAAVGAEDCHADAELAERRALKGAAL